MKLAHLNVMTEEQAHKRLCPERCYSQLDVNCVASKCMAWRVYDFIHKGDKITGLTLTRGYCGLAGPPGKRGWLK